MAAPKTSGNSAKFSGGLRWTPGRLRLAAALMARETFTYRDVGYLTGEQPGTVRVMVSRIGQAIPGLLETVGRSEADGAGRPYDIFRLAPGIREVLSQAIASARGEIPAGAERKVISHLDSLDQVQALIDKAIRNDRPLSARRECSETAMRLIERLSVVLDRARRDPEFEVDPALEARTRDLAGMIHIVDRAVRHELHASSVAIEGYVAKLCEEIGSEQPRLVHALEGIAERGPHNSDATPATGEVANVTAVLILGARAGAEAQMARRVRPFLNDSRFVNSIDRSVRELVRRACSLEAWQKPAIEVFSALARLPFSRIEVEKHPVAEAADNPDLPERVRERARRLSCHLPRGEGMGLRAEMAALLPEMA